MGLKTRWEVCINREAKVGFNGRDLEREMWGHPNVQNHIISFYFLLFTIWITLLGCRCYFNLLFYFFWLPKNFRKKEGGWVVFLFVRIKLWLLDVSRCYILIICSK